MKIRKIVLFSAICALLQVSVLFSPAINAVSAAGVICNGTGYEVSTVDNSGNYIVNACYATFEEAKASMKVIELTVPDVVVRHETSKSPSKIIAMTRGILATYGFRRSIKDDKNGMTYIYSSYNSSNFTVTGTRTYLVSHMDMAYYDTINYNPSSGDGIVSTQVAGFKGYVYLGVVDLIPMKFVDRRMTFTLGGTTNPNYLENPFSMVPHMNEFRVFSTTYRNAGGATITTRDIDQEYFSLWSGKSRGTTLIGPAPEWLPNGTFYSWDGITFYTDRDCKNPILNGSLPGEYYNYYEYLSLRSKSVYNSDELNLYNIASGYTFKAKTTADVALGGSALFGEGQAFITGQEKYGVNALLTLAMAYHESGSGTSLIAITKNNLFGWGAVDSDPLNGAYYFPTITDDVLEHTGANLRGYMSVDDWRFNGSDIGTKGSGFGVQYASDQYWGYKIAGRAYRIDRYLGLRDYNAYKIAILKDNVGSAVEKSTSNSTDLYSLKTTFTNFPVIINGATRSGNSLWVTTPSTMPVDVNGNATLYVPTSGTKIEYNWPKSIGYFNTTMTSFKVPSLMNGKLTQKIEGFAWNGNSLVVSGYAFIPGYNTAKTVDASHLLVLTASSNGQRYEFNMGDTNLKTNVSDAFGANLLNYDGTGFLQDNIDFSTLVVGNYSLSLKYVQNNYGVSLENPLICSGDVPVSKTFAEKVYVFTPIKDGSGNVTGMNLNVTNADITPPEITVLPYELTATKNDITVNVTINEGTVNAENHTFTENGSFEFVATDAVGNVSRKTISITNIDKVAPIITIGNYTKVPTFKDISVTAVSNEGTLNADSHTFTENGSFEFIATDAAGNVTRQTITITNIDKTLPPYSVEYRSHIQYIGWQDVVSDGEISGTTGRALRLEGIDINIVGGTNLGIMYSAHVQNIGWQQYSKDGNLSGTLGQSLRLEAIKIELTGADAANYDVYYRVHAQNFGWLDWAVNGQASGTEGYGYRLEAIQIVIVAKGDTAPGPTAVPFASTYGMNKILYRANIQSIGWQGYVADGAIGGTSGKSLRLEGINILLGTSLPSGSVSYQSHVQDYGWMPVVSNGQTSGVLNQAKRLEAIRISLSGTVSTLYDIYYRVHSQNFGWLGWAKNGESAGTANYQYRAEAIQIVLVPKGAAAPGSTANSFMLKQ